MDYNMKKLNQQQSSPFVNNFIGILPVQKGVQAEESS